MLSANDIGPSTMSAIRQLYIIELLEKNGKLDDFYVKQRSGILSLMTKEEKEFKLDDATKKEIEKNFRSKLPIVYIEALKDRKF